MAKQQIVEIVGTEKFKTLMNSRLESREWWIVVVPPSMLLSQDVMDFLSGIERQFYSDEANADYDPWVMPGGICLIFLHKRRMKSTELASILAPRLNKYGLSSEDLPRALETQDCLWLGEVGSQQAMMDLAVQLDFWRTHRKGQG